MPARLFSLAEVARFSQVPMSAAYRLLNAGELEPDFVTDRLALFAESRLATCASIFAAHPTVSAALAFANRRRGARSHTPRKAHHQVHDENSGALHTRRGGKAGR